MSEQKANSEPARQKITILGGGLGGMAAACALSAPDQNDRYDITVYTMGWRLGGKGASGRNAEIGNRIEEHGLHIWFGCYDNSFTLMRAVYQELARPPEAPLATLESAFRGQNQFVLMENVEGDWRPWRLEFPENDFLPGGHPELWDFLIIIMDWVITALKNVGLENSDVAPAMVSDLIDSFAKPDKSVFLKALNELTHLHVADLAHGLWDHLKKIGKPPEKHPGFWAEAMAEAVKLLAEFVWSELKGKIPQDDNARRMWIFTNLGTTIMRGILLDDLIANGVDHINAIEGRQWLRNNASLADDAPGDPNGLAFDHAPIQALYDACFAYVDGDKDKPDFSAATLLRACLWLPFSYKGAFAFEMQAGMGDTVFVPFYQVLLSRGVKFNFFSEATDLRASGDGKSLESITITRQVTTKGGNYGPLVKVRDLLCWPSAPLFDQIEQGGELKNRKIDLEHYNSGWQNTGPEMQLKAGKDFDHVVFAIPLPAHEKVCPQLISQSQNWTGAVQNVQATRTLAAQLWFSSSRQELGVSVPPVITGTFVEPWASLADFSHLILREDWSQKDVNYLSYTCGALPKSAGATQEAAKNYVFNSICGYLENDTEPLWPCAYDAGTITGFDWNVLWSDSPAEGENRLRSQYWRANIDVNELYILSTHTGMKHRPNTQAAGLRNLYFAGDWTNNGFNISSVEGAVMSGLQASRAISGHPKNIVGENPRSLSPSK